MKWTVSRIGSLIGGLLAIISYFQYWVIVYMPHGDYSNLAGSDLEVMPYKITLGLIALGAACLGMLSNLTSSVIGGDSSTMNRILTIACGLFLLGFAIYPYYSARNFARLYPIIDSQVARASLRVRVDIIYEPQTWSILMGGIGGLMMAAFPSGAFFIQDTDEK